MKKRIRLTEADIHRIVRKCVNEVLKEDSRRIDKTKRKNYLIKEIDKWAAENGYGKALTYMFNLGFIDEDDFAWLGTYLVQSGCIEPREFMTIVNGAQLG